MTTRRVLIEGELRLDSEVAGLTVVCDADGVRIRPDRTWHVVRLALWGVRGTPRGTSVRRLARRLVRFTGRPVRLETGLGFSLPVARP